MKTSANETSPVYSFKEKNTNASGNYTADEHQSAKHKSDSKEKTADRNDYNQLHTHTYLKVLQAMADEDRPE